MLFRCLSRLARRGNMGITSLPMVLYIYILNLIWTHLETSEVCGSLRWSQGVLQRLSRSGASFLCRSLGQCHWIRRDRVGSRAWWMMKTMMPMRIGTGDCILSRASWFSFSDWLPILFKDKQNAWRWDGDSLHRGKSNTTGSLHRRPTGPSIPYWNWPALGASCTWHHSVQRPLSAVGHWWTRCQWSCYGFCVQLALPLKYT